jgi:HEAT repeat protein
MTRIETRRSLFHTAREALQRSALQRLVRSAATSDDESVAIDVDEIGAEGIELLCKMAVAFSIGDPRARRLELAFTRTGSMDRIVSRLFAPNVDLQVQSLRVIGALRIDSATTWIVPMLGAGDRAVREAAARALGRIGGTSCAQALLETIETRGANRIVVTELARCAPDQFLEVAIRDSQSQSVKLAAVTAAGLRGSRAAISPLTALLGSGSTLERIAACRALSWIGSANAIAAVRAAQSDVQPAVRSAAGRALKALLARSGAMRTWPTRQLETI